MASGPSPRSSHAVDNPTYLEDPAEMEKDDMMEASGLQSNNSKQHESVNLNSYSLKLNSLPNGVANALRDLDADNDGDIDVTELQQAVQAFQADKKRVKFLRKALAIATIMMIIGGAALFGLVYAVVVLTKETDTGDNGVMYVAGTETLVRVGNAESTMQGSTMVTNDGRTIGTRQAPLQNVSLSSTLPNAAFDELKVLKISGENNAFLSLTVLGWIRIPRRAGVPGSRSTVKIITHPGHILVDGTTLEFQDLVGEVFVEAGFAVDSTSRKLLGLYELMGLFNSIEWGDELEEDELEPGFGGGAVIEYKVRYPCLKNNTSRCTTGVGTYKENLANVMGEYAVVTYQSQIDAINGIVVETRTNAEWGDDSLVEYKSPGKYLSVQYHDDNSYYCVEKMLEGTSPQTPTWNISSAEKMEEQTLADGTVERHFFIQAYVDKATYAALVDDSEATGYNGTLGIHYYDIKENAFPLKVVYSSGIEIHFVSYTPDPTLDLTGWALPRCQVDVSEVPKFSTSPYMANYDRRRLERCEASGNLGCGTARPQEQMLAQSRNTTVEADASNFTNPSNFYGNATTTATRRKLLQAHATCRWTNEMSGWLGQSVDPDGWYYASFKLAEIRCAELGWTCKGITYVAQGYSPRGGTTVGDSGQNTWEKSWLKIDPGNHCTPDLPTVEPTSAKWVISPTYGASCAEVCADKGMTCDDLEFKTAVGGSMGQLPISDSLFDSLVRLNRIGECKLYEGDIFGANAADAPYINGWGSCVVAPSISVREKMTKEPSTTCAAETGRNSLRGCWCTPLSTTISDPLSWVGKTVILESFHKPGRHLSMWDGNVLTTAPQWPGEADLHKHWLVEAANDGYSIGLKNVATQRYLQMAPSSIGAGWALNGWERFRFSPAGFGGDNTFGLFSVWHSNLVDVPWAAATSSEKWDGHLPGDWGLETWIAVDCDSNVALNLATDFLAWPNRCVAFWHPHHHVFLQMPEWDGPLLLTSQVSDGQLPSGWTLERFTVVNGGDGTLGFQNARTGKFISLRWTAVSGSGSRAPGDLPPSWTWERFKVVPSPAHWGRVGLWNPGWGRFIQSPFHVNAATGVNENHLLTNHWWSSAWNVKVVPEGRSGTGAGICPATCWGDRTCGEIFSGLSESLQDHITCYRMESLGCDCSGCSECTPPSKLPTGVCATECPESDDTCECLEAMPWTLNIIDKEFDKKPYSLNIEFGIWPGFGCNGLSSAKINAEFDMVSIYGSCEGKTTDMCGVEENTLQCAIGAEINLWDFLVKFMGPSFKKIVDIAKKFGVEMGVILGMEASFDGEEVALKGLARMEITWTTNLILAKVQLAAAEVGIELEGVYNFPHRYIELKSELSAKACGLGACVDVTQEIFAIEIDMSFLG